jgi:regulator of protease activity HflC (stomatin/prohibitin superfamily)
MGVAAVTIGVIALGIGFVFAGWFWLRKSVVINDSECGLLYVDGIFQRELKPGKHYLFPPWKQCDVNRVAVTEQFSNGVLTDVTSKDGLPLRMAAIACFVPTDPRAFNQGRSYTHLTNSVMTALADLAAANNLHDMQKDRIALTAALLARVGQPCADIDVRGVHISALQLPPETRRLFIEVEKARLEGLAALERARGEHASLRALTNAARLLKDNPELMNLRLLQTIASSKGSNSIVLGQGALESTAKTNTSLRT